MAGELIRGPRRRMRRLVTGGFVALAAVGLAALGWSVYYGSNLTAASNVVGIVSSLLGTLGVLGTSVHRRAVDTDVLNGAAEGLAQVVLTQQRRHRERLLGADYRAIDLTFRYGPEPARNAEHAAERGSFAAVGDYYRRLEPRRLAITGEPGSGKTLLAVELMVRLLEDRDGRVPVPCLFSLSAWDTAKPFADWLAAEVALAYGFPLSLARALVEHDRILPVLDGLDEMDPVGTSARRAEAALTQLNRYHRALVLTCRSSQYAALRGRRHRLWDCAVINLDDVTPSQAHDYLSSRAPYPDQWQGVLDDIRLAGSGALATTLTTPWLLTLASTVALADGSPRILDSFVGVAAQPTGARTLEHRLLQRFIPALTTLHPPPGGPRYDSAQVELWTGRLARFLRDTGGRNLAGRVMSGTDLVPHELWPITGLRAPRLITAAVTVALWLPVLITGSVLAARKDYFPHPGILGVLLVCALPLLAAWGTLDPWLEPRRIDLHRALTPQGSRRLGLALLLGAVLAMNAALAFSPGFGMLFGTGFAFVFGLGLATAVRWDIHLPTALVSAGVTAIVLGAAAGAAGARFGGSGGLVAGLGAGTLALFVAVKTGIVAARRYGGGLPDNTAATPHPYAALRHDITAGLLAGAITGVAAFVIGWRASWLAAPPPMAALLGLTAFLAAGPGFVSEAARRYLAMLLATRGQLPWRLRSFFIWAYDAGILRTTSTAYQFRHQQLQQWLAPATLTRGASPR
ncbi:NACHT domain-containing protein [Streptomyces boninensis]|uniref:NACHT domain-containing protein n=1 Tax=Streptomyces boninensis TaxID=2039455 RepID=UPI003B21A4C7